MTKEEYEDIVKIQDDLRNQPNAKLIECMDKLTSDFDASKDKIIQLTLYLDKVEELYNKILNEYQNRTK